MKTSFFLLCTAIILSACSLHSTAQDNPQIGLPESVVARIGKGSLGEVHFLPDGSQLAISTSIGIWFHDPQTGKALELFQRPDITSPYAFAFSPDGNRIGIGIRAIKRNASGSSRFSVEVWDTTTGEAKEMRLGHLHTVRSIVFSPDGNYIASVGGFSNTARLWNTQTGKSISIRRMHSKGINTVVSSLDGPTFATVGYDDVAYLWDGRTGNHKITLTGHTEQVSCIAYSPDNKTIATGSSDATIRLWDATTGTHQTTLASGVGKVMSLAYSPDGDTIACGSRYSRRIQVVLAFPRWQDDGTRESRWHCANQETQLNNPRTFEISLLFVGKYSILIRTYADRSFVAQTVSLCPQAERWLFQEI